METEDRLLTPGEVATLFRVDPKTVTRWAAAGRIGSIRTPGGHRRFRESEVRALLEGDAGAQTTFETGSAQLALAQPYRAAASATAIP
ncbi:BldC family transcriptional regulator [Glycomyces sp. NPDC048151]|uniref:BldC family transcriptional regulator n=1 Tax=Glycomyces sp. NPDC048151 TaxID=3364002 RepID=UPI003714D7BE